MGRGRGGKGVGEGRDRVLLIELLMTEQTMQRDRAGWGWMGSEVGNTCQTRDGSPGKRELSTLFCEGGNRLVSWRRIARFLAKGEADYAV